MGESLHYDVSMSPLGRVGRAEFRVLPPDSMAVDYGVVFASDVRAKVLFVVVHNVHRSWYDPEYGRTRGFVSNQRELGRSIKHDIRIDDRGRWNDAATGEKGQTQVDAPLDELAFLYVVREMPLPDGEEFALHRHFRDADNPVRITVRGRETLRVDTRDIRVIRLEVRFQPRRRFDSGGRVTLYLADDATRRLMRMDVDVPLVGHLKLELDAERSNYCREYEDQPFEGIRIVDAAE